MHVRGFEPLKPQGVAVLRTAAANRICLTCTTWRRERGFEPATPEGALAFRASALSLTRPSLQTGGSGASRTLTSRKMSRFGRGGLATCPALPNKLAVMRGFEPPGPDLHRVSDFPGQLFKPLTHITAKQNRQSSKSAANYSPVQTTNLMRATRERPLHAMLAESIRFERMTPMRCSALAVRRLRPLGQLSVFNCIGAGRGYRTPHVRRHCVLNAARLPIFRQAGTSLVGARGVEPPSPKALDSKSSAVSIFATLLQSQSWCG